MYFVFIDFKKAYDFIDRYSHWYTLLQVAVDGNPFSVVRLMYDEFILCVSHLNSFFQLFQYQDWFISRGNNLPDQLSMYILVFADDAIMFENSKEALQESFKDYCDKWSLTVNVDKTKVMVFRKRVF